MSSQKRWALIALVMFAFTMSLMVISTRIADLTEAMNAESETLVIAPDTTSGTVTAYENELGQDVIVVRTVDWEVDVVCYVHVIDGMPGDSDCIPFVREQR